MTNVQTNLCLGGIDYTTAVKLSLMFYNMWINSTQAIHVSKQKIYLVNLYVFNFMRFQAAYLKSFVKQISCSKRVYTGSN